jgi:16S rRNA (uracil1498-N3)-methyltransferase
VRRRFFADSVDGNQAWVEGANAAHLARVLRAQVGQQYELAFAGRAYLAQVVAVQKDRVGFDLIEELPPPPPSAGIELNAAVFKFDRLEWMLEKATELGVSRIQLVAAERSEPKLVAAAEKRLPRWRQIMFDAAQQSRRAELPELLPPCGLAAVLARPFPGRSLLLSEDPETTTMLAPGQPSTRLLAGPEGGFTGAESAAAQAACWQPVSLGPRILRCETAALAALARLIVPTRAGRGFCR